MKDFDTCNDLPKMWEIWANLLLPQALKIRPKSNKSPNLVTLINADARGSIDRSDNIFRFNFF